ncbi:MAG TPA: hypothetical protein VNI01_13995, partial [Elusimicrobiota bacterium]|nr:hypothetical protein [Elusimicrobiota bacterium]
MPPEPPQPPMRPVPPTLAQEPAQAQEASAVEVLRHRLETLEIELAREREKAQAADALLKQREAMRTEVEGEIRRLSEQFRQAKNVTQLEEERSQYRGRIEALEARLGELHASLTSLVQKALERPDPAPAPAPSPAAGGEVHSGLAALAQALERAREESSRRDEELRSSVRSMEELLRQPPAGLREALAPLEAQARALEGLQAELADGARRGADEERSLREQLREAVSGFAGEAAERLAAIDSRLAERLQDDAERLKAVERDRETLRQELQGEAREIRREASEARRDADETFERRL